MIGRLFKFHGGVKPDAHKHESAGVAIARAPLPSRLVVPLRQSTRASARCIVEIGQKVAHEDIVRMRNRHGEVEWPDGTNAVSPAPWQRSMRQCVQAAHPRHHKHWAGATGVVSDQATEH